MMEDGKELADLIWNVLLEKKFLTTHDICDIIDDSKNPNYGLRKVGMYFHQELVKKGVVFGRDKKGYKTFSLPNLTK